MDMNRKQEDDATTGELIRLLAEVEQEQDNYWTIKAATVVETPRSSSPAINCLNQDDYTTLLLNVRQARNCFIAAQSSVQSAQDLMKAAALHYLNAKTNANTHCLK